VHRPGLAASLFLVVSLTHPAWAGEPLVVDLWPGKTPGDVGASGQEASRIHQSPLVGPTKLITYEPIDAIDKVSCRPDFAVGCCSGYLKIKDRDEIRPDLRIPPDTPPIFLAHASDDKESYGGSIAEHSAFMYVALKRAGIPAELHIFATGDHDFGVRQNDKLPSSWPRLCITWLRSQGLLKPDSSP
jgi:acetyl esterase/lipase